MRWITFALIIAISLSGCASEEDTPEPNTDTEPTDPTGNETMEPVVNNTAPVASLVADAMNGTAPLFVNFTLNGTDAEGDNLTWTFSVNGNETANGTTLPSMVNATLDVGNHTIIFTVFDGNLSSEANLTIAVVAAAVEEVDPNAPVDYGTFIFDPVTGHCHYKSYTDVGGLGTLYNFDFWAWAEDNGVPGLQVGNTFPVGPAEDEGFRLDEWDICQDGDLMLF